MSDTKTTRFYIRKAGSATIHTTYTSDFGKRMNPPICGCDTDSTRYYEVKTITHTYRLCRRCNELLDPSIPYKPSKR